MQLNVSNITIKHKVILACISMILLMVFGMYITLYQLSQTTKLSTKVIETNQPATFNSLQLLKEVKSTSTLLNEYLLTGEASLEKEFYLRKKEIQKIYKRLHVTLNQHDTNYNDIMFSIDTLLNQYYGYADKLFYLRKNDLENYPGIALASELTDPHTLAYLGLLNEQINIDHTDLTKQQKQQVYKLLYDLRYSWIQMNNAFRIFMTTRRDSDLENFYSYSSVNANLHKRLRTLKIQLDFGALDQLEKYRQQRLNNVPTVAKIFQSDAWRKDAYLVKTKVNPLMVKLNTILQKLANDQIKISTQGGLHLSNTLSRTNTLVGVILFFGIIFAIFIANIILKSIKPISKLTQVVKDISIDNLVPIDKILIQRSDEVGDLAKAFDHMSSDLINDIYERKIAERKFETLLASSPDATVIVDKHGIINLYSQQAEVLFGYNNDEIIGQPLVKLMPERFEKSHTDILKAFMKSPNVRPMGEDLNLSAQHKDGSEFPVEIGLAPIETSEGLMVSATVRDITKRKETERLLVHQANYDILTDLPNRVLALDRLTHAITSARRNHQTIAVMFIDLDNFKQVNDSLGHSIGDKLLLEVGKRLNDSVRANDTVARLGGDEFLIIVPELSELFASDSIAEKIIDAMSSPYRIQERDLFISASIGITGYPEDSDKPDILLRNADAAMYQAKDAGRNTYRFFTPEMNEQLLQRLEIESQLRSALENQELYLQFQPMLNVQENKVLNVEALLRWENLKLGTVTPSIFIPIAEETGLINKIGTWVLNESCHAASQWQHQSNSPVRVSVNISAVQFRSGDLVQVVSQALESSRLPAELLELEITERVLVNDNLNVSRILSDLKKMGISLALDDFGTGYSSLSYLKRFSFDVLKIDRMFVSDITFDSETASLCKAIVAMAESLNLTVVAEGVETEEQYTYLRELGVHLLQGYYLSRAISNKEFIKLLNRKNFLVHSV